MRLELGALRDLLRRYADVWSAAWASRREMDPPPRNRDEREFLPAQLELQEAPVHPAPHWAMRIIVLMLVLTLAWSIWGKFEIVATAPGKVTLSGRAKVVQSLEPGIVRAIHIRNGQHVEAGAPLIELDTTVMAVEAGKSENEYQDARLALARTAAVLDALTRGKPVRMMPLDDVRPDRFRTVSELTVAQVDEYEGRMKMWEAELARRRAELSTNLALVARLGQTAAIADKQHADYQQLLARKFVSRHAALNQERERIAQQRDYEVQRSRTAELRAAVEAQERQIAAGRAEFVRKFLAEQNDAQQRLSSLSAERTKAAHRQTLASLRAPVAGTVQELAMHTVGGVVTTAQPLLVVVPDDALEIEATLDNKDIGFVRVGQPVKVKADAFPYIRYGHLTGTVVSISADALRDEKRGWVYQAMVRLDDDRLRVGDQWRRLSPGMSVTAEVVTGKRRAIAYFTEPLLEAGMSGFRER